MKFSILNKIFKGKNRKVGVALGGGAVRGLAHIGVLRVLEENDIPIDCISGVSSGSIVGCIYASGRSACELIEIMKESGWSDIGQVTVSKKGLFSSQKIEDFIKKYSKTNDFSKTKIPFAVSSVDLITGEEVIIKKGELSKAVRASVSFPGIYIPFEYNNKVLVDGSIENILPKSFIRNGS